MKPIKIGRKTSTDEKRPLCDSSPIPQFLKQAAKYILNHADKEGLFRVSPDYTELQMLQNELEATGDVKDVSQHDVYCVCSLLKFYYKQMKPKLINAEVAK